MEKVALITGAARRIGAVVAKELHHQGMKVILHYHHSRKEAEALANVLNTERKASAVTLPGDLRDSKVCDDIVAESIRTWGRLDILVNNASSFYPTLIGEVQENQWQDLIGSNLKGPFFLSQAATPYLQENEGCIINIVDIHADRPLKNYTVYCIAKAGLVMLTKALARELAPSVRVNAVAPGVILWPNDEDALSEEVRQHIIQRTCLKRKGSPQDIADTILFLIKQQYITGQVIAVDGGRNIKD